MKLINSLDRIEKLLRQDALDIESLRKAYEWTLRLRSQLLSTIYDYEQYGKAEKPTTEATAPVTSQSKSFVTLTINEPLPGLKELTAAVEDHWISMIHKAIYEESRTGIPKFEKAFVMIEITTPRGSNNSKVWDTSNRAINVIINNLKGIFFRDDDFEHMACGIVADWGENGRTTIRICELEDLLGVWFSVRKSKIYDLSQNLIEYKLRRSSIGCKIYRNMLICSNMQVQKNHKNRGVL